MKGKTSKPQAAAGIKKGGAKTASVSIVAEGRAGSSIHMGGSGGREPTYEVCIQDKCATLTVDDLTVAIRKGIDSDGMPEEQARETAQRVLNFFGFSERIIDNILEPEDRDAFYQLEDTGILTTEREETTLYDGREWRIHYWLFKKERIFEIINHSRAEGVGIDEVSVYADIPDDIWKRTG
ncbi:MAG: DUF6015 family protein [Methanomassiliicoccales archaeon]